MNFSEKLKYVRGVLLISQKELADLLGVSFCTINRLENGRNKPNFITEKKFELLCSKNSLFFRSENEEE